VLLRKDDVAGTAFALRTPTTQKTAMNTDDTIRVLLVDGSRNETTTGSLRQTLSGVTGIMLTGEVGSGEEALAAARHLQPDVIVMLADCGMPGMDSIDTAGVIAGERLPARVVILTENVVRSLVPAVKAGVAGLFSPDAGHEELLMAIRRIHQWSPYSVSMQ